MKLIGHPFWDNKWFGRLVLLLLALTLVLSGVAALMGGRLNYRNYWGGVVFAPVAIALGLAILVFLIVFWNRLTERGEVLKGKAARKARQAHRARPAVETFDDPWTGGGA